jgi:photosystem II stability/assembly factor-like uncharacterized protein
VPPSIVSPRAVRGLALIVVSLVALAAAIALHVRPGPSAPPPMPAAARQPDPASTMDWVSDREGWISALDRRAGTSTLFHTTDAGRHWSRQRVAGSVETPQFFDSLNGFTSSPDGTFRTSDGGRHWQRLTLPRGAGAQQPAFADLRHGWVWVEPAGLYATADGGARWRRLAAAGLPVTRTPPRLLGFRDGLHGWLALGASLFGTADGGATWSPARPLPTGTTSLATSRADGSVAWAWSAAELQVTRDGGAHWTRVAMPVAWSLLRLQALGASSVWVAAIVIDALGAPRWTLFWTGDAGLTWIPAIPPVLG